MEHELYLLWDTQFWGVYGANCPDPGAFPSHWYKKYVVPDELREKVFRRLLDIKEGLIKENVFPTRENYDEIFPKLEELMQ